MRAEEMPPLELPEHPKLAQNIIWFARALRKAGLPIGTGRVIDAIAAVSSAGFTHRTDFYWSLQACFVSRPEHRRVFAQVFRLFWRDPRFMEHMMAMLLPSIRGVQEDRQAQAAEKRAAEALLDGLLADMPQNEDGKDDETRLDVDASQTASARERLRQLDFEQMSTAEIAEAKRMLAKLRLPVPPLRTRRTRRAACGPYIDGASSLRQAMRRGGHIEKLHKKEPRWRWPNLVVLCDISGSMSQYSRMVLHFLHAVANQKGAGWAALHAFTFGTRLTNISRHLHQRDVDAALAAAGAEAQDWEGGTRIGTCLHRFNQDWSRRVLGQGAVVLLITDGLDRDAPDLLQKSTERLSLSARKLIWLNPLLRWDGFAPKAQGISILLPLVDSFRAGHNIASLEALSNALSKPDEIGDKARYMAMLRQS